MSVRFVYNMLITLVWSYQWHLKNCHFCIKQNTDIIVYEKPVLTEKYVVAILKTKMAVI